MIARQARAAAKRVTSQNAAAVRRLLIGFIGTGIFHVVLKALWPGTNGTRKGDWVFFGLTALIEQGLGMVLIRTARSGGDLTQPGLTQVIWDSIYLLWFVHVTTALISNKFWLVLLLLPCYAVYLGYSKLLVPFVFGGQDPLALLWRRVTGQSPASPTSGGPPGSGADGAPEQPLSKRQQKLQKRADRGDPRVQMQQRRGF